MSRKVRSIDLVANTLTASEISATAGILTASLADGTRIFFADGTVVATGAFNMGGNKITGGALPTSGSDFATKTYVDSLTTSMVLKPALRGVYTANVTVTNPGSAGTDGIAFNPGDRLLLAGQTDQIQNGPYLWNGSASALTRTNDVLAPGATFVIDEGTTGAGSLWVLTEPVSFTGNITVGTTAIPLTKIQNAAVLTAGSGISIASNIVTAVAAPSGGVQVTAGGIGLLLSSTLLTLGAGGLGVNTTPGSGLTTYAAFPAPETFTGDGSTTTFTSAYQYQTILGVFERGLYQTPSGTDITLGTAGGRTTVTFAVAPVSGDPIQLLGVK